MPTLQRFRASWPYRDLVALKKLPYLRAFFRFSHDAGWIAENPAPKLENPRAGRRPTLPFTPKQLDEILAACEKYGAKYRGGRFSATENVSRIRAFVLLLRHAGLRLGEAVTLERSRIIGDKLFLPTAKTAATVYVPLPPVVLSALAAAPQVSERCFFWPDGSKVNTAISHWRQTMKDVFDVAGIPDGHAHRFRQAWRRRKTQANSRVSRRTQ